MRSCSLAWAGATATARPRCAGSGGSVFEAALAAAGDRAAAGDVARPAFRQARPHASLPDSRQRHGPGAAVGHERARRHDMRADA